MTDRILADLTKRRAEIVTEAKALDAPLTKLLADIAHLDGTIKQFNPGYSSRPMRLSRAQRLDISWIMMGVLRGASVPMSAREITLRVMAEHGRDRDNAKAVRETLDRVRFALLRQSLHGLIRGTATADRTMFWEVVP